MAHPHPALSFSAAQRGILSTLPDSVPPGRIDRLWIFASRTVKGRESGLFVLSLLPPQELQAGQRNLLTLRYRAETVKGKPFREEMLEEEGSAPAERIERVIAGVLSRTGEQDADPILACIEGSQERWEDFLSRAGIMLDRIYQE